MLLVVWENQPCMCHHWGLSLLLEETVKHWQRLASAYRLFQGAFRGL